MYFGSVEKPPRLAESQMEIPKTRIAQKPHAQRDKCKLMVLDRKDESIHHLKFKDITDFFKKGDVLVKNHTKVCFVQRQVFFEKTPDLTTPFSPPPSQQFFAL